jgi:putative transposase
MLTEDSLERSKAYRKFMASTDDEELLNIFSQRQSPAFLGSEKFAAMLKRKFFPKKMNPDVSQSNAVEPGVDYITQSVASFYGMKMEDLFRSRRGHFNEPRNVAIYLIRKLRGDTLNKISDYFGMDKYSSISSVVERMKALVVEDAILREKVEKLLWLIAKSQEQT